MGIEPSDTCPGPYCGGHLSRGGLCLWRPWRRVSRADSEPGEGLAGALVRWAEPHARVPHRHAEDLAAAFAEHLWEGLASGRLRVSSGCPVPYLREALRHFTANWLRRVRRREGHEAPLPLGQHGVAEPWDWDGVLGYPCPVTLSPEDRLELREALGKLPEPDRRFLTLISEGHTPTELAETSPQAPARCGCGSSACARDENPGIPPLASAAPVPGGRRARRAVPAGFLALRCPADFQDKRLETPVSLHGLAVPLKEVLEQIRSATGVTVSAAADIEDARLVALVDKVPARSVLRAIVGSSGYTVRESERARRREDSPDRPMSYRLVRSQSSREEQSRRLQEDLERFKKRMAVWEQYAYVEEQDLDSFRKAHLEVFGDATTTLRGGRDGRRLGLFLSGLSPSQSDALYSGHRVARKLADLPAASQRLARSFLTLNLMTSLSPNPEEVHLADYGQVELPTGYPSSS